MRAPERVLSNDKLAGHLPQRCGGSIGVLCNWLAATAVVAIETGEERLTRRLLDEVPLPDIT